MSSEKASRYINQLYTARCNSQWNSVPELARKVEKHAPSRKCLALAARFGASLWQESRSFLSSSSAQHYLESLKAAIAAEKDQAQEAFEARICTALLLSASGSPQDALSILEGSTQNLQQRVTNIDDDLAIWAAVCIINGNAAKAAILEVLQDIPAAMKTYTEFLPYLSQLLQRRPQSLELLRCIQQFLSSACVSLYNANEDDKSEYRQSLIMAFRLLSQINLNKIGKAPHRRISRIYLEILSQLITEGNFCTSGGLRNREALLPAESRLLASQLYQEYLQATNEFENLLLKETRFPKATESNGEVLKWANLVMKDWAVLCGPDWSDEELGSGGKIAVGRRTLDILYRAASYTFHSTQLLRHLFTVHAFLGEFELAFKAFDVYVDIITKGKARVEKSEDDISDMDDDETSILFAANAINILCRYGPSEAAEKAVEVAAMLERWLLRSESKSSKKDILDGGHEHTEPLDKTAGSVSPSALSSAYHAIGISQAQWSRYTYNVKLREELQQKAIRSLQHSLKYTPESEENIGCLYALALLQGEMREITAAINTAKRTLRRSTTADSLAKTNGNFSAETFKVSKELDQHFFKERQLLPVWHLLSLLLTTREDFSVAEESCEAAFRQFQTPEVLFGKGSVPASRGNQRSRKLSATLLNEKNLVAEPLGLVDRMDPFEKQYILDIKMTQMLLLEIEEGPEVAVNTGHELLALYARLFGAEDNLENRPPPTAASVIPPQSSKGTIRSKFVKDTPLVSRPGTTTTTAPTIQIANENGVKLNNEQFSLHNLPTDTQNPSFLTSASSGRPRKSNEIVHTRPTTSYEGEKRSFEDHVRTEAKPRHSLDTPNNKGKDWPLGPVPPAEKLHVDSLSNHVAQGGIKPASMFENQALDHQVSYSGRKQYRRPLPNPHLLGLQRRRFRTRSLFRIWLLVAGLYSRASLFEDSREAVEEAEKLVAALEAKICSESSSIKAFQEEPWGASESLEELWADVYSERGNLLLAQSLSHEAMESFEKALVHCPDHLEAIVGLSQILLDMYCKIIPPEKPDPAAITNRFKLNPEANPTILEPQKEPGDTSTASTDTDLSPPERNRLAARDRACGLLSSVTKLGDGWDSSEAWFVLARAYEESGQTDRARDALWWTVELENTKPLRRLRMVNPGGYVL